MSGLLGAIGAGLQSAGSLDVRKDGLDPFVFTDKPTRVRPPLRT